MIVCQCRRISDRHVRDAVERGASNLVDLARDCGAGSDCSGCHETLEALLGERNFTLPQAGDPRRLVVVAA